MGRGAYAPGFSMRVAYTITIFLGALLLFVVQPMAGKMLLPLFGGTPAVWNTCMVFFQAALLAGYAYAHLLTKIPGVHRQMLLHGAILATASITLPMALGDATPDLGSPVLWLLGALVCTIGPPFVAVSATAPLLQRWFSTAGTRSSRDPYFLYAASNAGSLLALLGYPLLLEPLLALDGQRLGWSIGYATVALLTICCGLTLLRRSGATRAIPVQAPPEHDAAPPSRRDYLKWIALAFVPSSLMLGVTQHITTDIAAIPLFWIVPLAIYLLTYILAFSGRAPSGPYSRMLLIVTVPTLAVSVVWSTFPMWLMLGLHLAILFVGAMMCHGRLAESRPHPRHLTSFYLAIALGGALGGVFNAILAPQLFDSVFEYPLAIAMAVMLRDRSMFRRSTQTLRRAMSVSLDVGVLALVAIHRPLIVFLSDVDVLLQQRTFFGVHWVASEESGKWTGYYQGSTLHGLQIAGQTHTPVGYYHKDSGIGRLYERMRGDPRLERVGLVGLGAGTLAAYARAGQRYTFYEIDPAVVRIAQNPELFTYLHDMPTEATIVIGDGRLSLAREPDDTFGLIVLDAFSSDAIPVHLLTREAIDLYFDKLVPDGLLAIHATNRHVDLGPLVAGLARDRGLAAVQWVGEAPDDASIDKGLYFARWLFMGRSEQALAPLLTDERFVPLPAPVDAPVWTDNFSNVLAVVDWAH